MTGGVHEISARRAARQISPSQLSSDPASPDMSIKTLGPPRIESPLGNLLDSRQTTEHYVDESDRVLTPRCPVAPSALTVSKRNQVDPHGDLWMSVLEATGQPVRFG